MIRTWDFQVLKVHSLKPLSYTMFYTLILKLYSSYDLHCSILKLLFL